MKVEKWSRKGTSLTMFIPASPSEKYVFQEIIPLSLKSTVISHKKKVMYSASQIKKKKVLIEEMPKIPIN